MKNTNYFLPVLLLFFFQTTLQAQFAENIRTGRPGQAIGAYAVGKNVFQVQAGGNYSNFYIGNNDDVEFDKVFAGTAVLRYGITEKLEVSAVGTYRDTDAFIQADANEQEGISNTQVGLRYNLIENKGAIPAVGLQGRVLLRAQDENFQRENTGAKVILATGNRLTDRVSLTTNFSMTWAGDNSDAAAAYAAVFSIGLSEKWSTFAEMYGSFNDFTTNFDTGLAYLCNSNLQFDVSVGVYGPLKPNLLFVDAGVSWRIHNR